MLVTLLRTFILYIVIIFGVRLMGKRQLGELQPSELVVTILISNIATLPIEEVDVPMIFGLLPILSLVTFEVLFSALNLRCRTTRRLFSGRPVIIISNGKLNQKKLKELRFSSDDLMAQLRSNGIFSVSDVDFALVETTGKVSVYQKFLNQSVTPEIMNLPDNPQKNHPALLVVSDGVVFHNNLAVIGKDEKWVKEMAATKKAQIKDIYIMTADITGKYELIEKDKAIR